MAFYKKRTSVFSLSPQKTIKASVFVVFLLATDVYFRQERTTTVYYYSAESELPGINLERDQVARRIKPEQDHIVSPIHHEQDDVVPIVEPCLEYIFYDKPVKTGSTAITEAIRQYLSTISESAKECYSIPHCTHLGEEVCSGKEPKGNMVEHVYLNSSMTACLRRKGYYHVTSIRDPKERIISAWKYSRSERRNHYGINYNSTLLEWVYRFPKCALYFYYDGLPQSCTKEEALERAEEIASRFDEVIDLSDSAVGDLHQRILSFVKEANVAPGGRSKVQDFSIPDEAVELEYLLYNKLREKRLSLSRRKARALCSKVKR